MSAALRRSYNSLQVPNYRRYFVGQVVSVSGNWMQIVAEMWLIVQLTGSGAAVGITAGLQFLPLLLFAGWGGVLADRLDKRLDRRDRELDQRALRLDRRERWLERR